MAAVLGIDAAWTATEPSGVALIRKNPDDGRWAYVKVAPSYNAFVAAAKGNPVQWDERPSCGCPEPERLLMAAKKLLKGERISVISVDMPMSKKPIKARRYADNAVSRKFGKMWCSTHSPSADRPGAISTKLLCGLSDLGYELAVNCPDTSHSINSVIEVYPHPALLSLLNCDFRIPYKVSRSKSYWKELSVPERANRLIEKFQIIQTGLAEAIQGIPPDFLPKCPYGGTLTSLKRYEDALDALVCAWVGAQYLEGCAIAYGDCDAAIWVPELK